MLNGTLRACALFALGLVLSTHAAQGQVRSQYRDYQLGSDLASVAALANVAATEARTIHQRPAVMQELAWRRPYFVSGTTALQNDPVQQIVFSFYNDQLFRLVISYDRQRTDGMTEADMIAGMSEAYGPPLAPTPKKSPAVASHVETESGAPVARWEDADFSVVLYRSSYASEFRAVVTSVRLDALARAADTQALQLDESEAPQREIARQKKEVEDSRASQEKARAANKAVFRP